MATRKKTVPATPRIPDSLIVERESFKGILIKRIELGKELLNTQITQTEQLEKLEKDFYKWDDYNSEYLKQSFNNEKSEYKYEYDHRNDWVGGVFGGRNTPQERYQDLRKEIANKIENLEKLVDKTDLLKSEIKEQISEKKESFKTDNVQNVFIVYGHNVAVQQSVARVIEKLGLNPIILHEQPNNGKTIIEKFEKHSDVGFAIILMTDDDDGKSKSEIDLKSRARQNVILELGYFIGKLGRERVLPLHSEGVELPSDIHGLLYIPIDKADNWKFAIVKELKAIDFEVDANRLL